MTRSQNQQLDDVLRTIGELRRRLTELIADHQKLALAAQALRVTARGTNPLGLEEAAKRVLKDIAAHPGAARAEIVERTRVQPDRVTKIVTALSDNHQLVQLGSRRGTRWFTPETLAEITKKE